MWLIKKKIKINLCQFVNDLCDDVCEGLLATYCGINQLNKMLPSILAIDFKLKQSTNNVK